MELGHQLNQFSFKMWCVLAVKEAYLNAIILKCSSAHILMMLLWHVKVCIGTHGSNCGVHKYAC